MAPFSAVCVVQGKSRRQGATNHLEPQGERHVHEHQHRAAPYRFFLTMASARESSSLPSPRLSTRRRASATRARASGGVVVSDRAPRVRFQKRSVQLPDQFINLLIFYSYLHWSDIILSFSIVKELVGFNEVKFEF